MPPVALGALIAGVLGGSIGCGVSLFRFFQVRRRAISSLDLEMRRPVSRAKRLDLEMRRPVSRAKRVVRRPTRWEVIWPAVIGGAVGGVVSGGIGAMIGLLVS